MLRYLINEDSQIAVTLDDHQLRRLASMLAAELRNEDDEMRKQERDTLITCQRACELLGKDRSTLWRWASEGYLVPIRVGRSVRYRLGDVQDILEGKR